MESDLDTLKTLLKAKEDALYELKTSFDECVLCEDDVYIMFRFKEEAKEYEKELEADNEHKEKEIQSLLQKLEIATKKIEEYKKENNQSSRIMERDQAKIESLSQEMTSLKAKIVSLEQLNEDLQKEIRNVQFEKQELSEKLEIVEERAVIERVDLEEKLNRKNEELEKFRQDLHEYEDEIVQWKRQSFQRTGSTRDSEKPMENKGSSKNYDEIERLAVELQQKEDIIEQLNMEIRRIKCILEEERTNKCQSASNKKDMSRNLYIKPSQNDLPECISLQKKCILIDGQDDESELPTSYFLDAIFRDVEDMNLQEMLASPLNTFFGKTLMFLICGPKKTDKKQIKYKLLQDLIRIFRALSMKTDFQDKTCKIAIKMKDSTILSKLRSSKSSAGSHKWNRFIIGDVESEQKLYEYVKNLKELDFRTKSDDIQDSANIASKKSGIKQITVDLCVQNKVRENKKETQNCENPLITRVNITIASIQKNNESVFTLDELMKRGVFKGDVSKFFFLTIDPSQSPAIASETLNILEEIENCHLNVEALLTPVKNEDCGPNESSSENDSMDSEEKVYVPKKTRSDALVQASLDLSQNKRKQYRNNCLSTSLQITDSQESSDLMSKSSSYKNDFSSKISNLFSFVQKFKKSKTQYLKSKSFQTDIDMSILPTEPDIQDSKVIKKLIVDLE